MTDYLIHHGIKGQKWGLRRFQNEDMSLTPAGRERYGVGEKRKAIKQQYKDAKKRINADWDKATGDYLKTTNNGTVQNKEADRKFEAAADKWSEDRKAAKSQYKSDMKDFKNSEEYKAARKEQIKKAVKVGAVVAGTALAAYGAYKIVDMKKNSATKTGSDFMTSLYKQNSFAKNATENGMYNRIGTYSKVNKLETSVFPKANTGSSQVSSKPQISAPTIGSQSTPKTSSLYKESYGGKDISSFNNRVDAFNKINDLTNMSKSSTSYNDKRLAKNAADTKKTFDELDNLTATLMKMNMNDLKKMGL